MAIANKLEIIYDSCKDIRDVITEKNSSLGKGNITTLGSDVTKICNPNSYIHKVIREAITETQTDPDTGEETEVITGYNYKREDEYVGSNYTELPNSKFNGNTNLISVIIPSTVKTVNYRAFYGCTNLQYVNVENTQTIGGTSGGGAFANCTNLKIDFNYKVLTRTQQGEFENCGITSFKCESGNVFSGASNTGSMFRNCTNLKTVEFPDVNIYGWNYMFDGCTHLTSVTPIERFTYLGAACFRNCKELKIVIDMPNLTTVQNSFTNSGITGVESLGRITSNTSNGLFENCKNLTYVKLPTTLTRLGNYAFRYCTALTTVYVYATTPPTIGTGIFNGCSALTNIYVPADSVATYQSASGWSAYASKISAIPSE